MDTMVLDALRRAEIRTRLRTLSKGLSCMRISGVCLALAFFPGMFCHIQDTQVMLYRWMGLCGLAWITGCGIWAIGLAQLRLKAGTAERRYITAALAFLALLPAAPLALLDPSFDKGLAMTAALAALLVMASTASTGMAVWEVARACGCDSQGRSRISTLLETIVFLFLFGEGALLGGFAFVTNPEMIRSLLLCSVSAILTILAFGPLSGLHTVLWYMTAPAARPPRIRVLRAPGSADATPPSSPAVSAEIRSADTTRVSLPRVAVALLLAAAIARLAASFLPPV
jgi:hypothetical protein